MKLGKHLVEKPWGRTDIPPEFGDMDGRRIGEIWYEGRQGEALPILVKWLFTSEKLSIQVHPDDAQAQARGMPSGKEECWYIVDAEPGAVLGLGTTHKLSADKLREASLSGEIENLIDWKPVQPGDYFYIPAGTVHAIGAGITLVEVQQYADITYRLYDYARPRELHLDDGVDVALAGPYWDPRSGHVTGGDVQLVDGPHFKLRYIDNGEVVENLPRVTQCWVVPLSGQVDADGEIAGVGDCLLIDGLSRLILTGDARILLAY